MTSDSRTTQKEKYFFHKKEFKIMNSVLLDTFEEHIFDGKCFSELECSCKLNNDKVFSSRFNAWFKDTKDLRQAMPLIFRMFNDYEKKSGFLFDTDLLKRIAKDVDYTDTSQIITGLDIREQAKDSRVKLWFIAKNNPEKTKKLLDEYKDNSLYSLISEGLFSEELLFGYDFYPDKHHEMKIYPIYSGKDVVLLLNRRIIPNERKLLDVISGSGKFHISYKNSNSDKIYHLRPKDESTFIWGLKCDALTAVYARISKFSPRNKLIVSLDEKEIISGKITSANIYY